MTKHELNEITQERKYISNRLYILDPDNAIENQERERLLHRLDFLEHKIDCALLSIRRNRLRIVAS